MKNVMGILAMLLLPAISHSALVGSYSFEGSTSEGGTWSGTTGSYTTGVSGQAALFDGFDDALDLGNIYAIGASDFSVAFWARFDAGPPDQQLISTGDQGISGLIAFTYANNRSKLIRLVTQEIIGGSNFSDNLYTVDTYDQGIWVHVVATRSGSAGRIYVDGALQNSENDLRSGDLGSGSWRLGLGHQGAYFKGAIDELRVFDHVLSQAEVDSLLDPDPVERIQNLIDVIMDLNLNNGVANSLDAKLEAALNALDDMNVNNDIAAINSLYAFLSAVDAQSGDQIGSSDAAYLISLVNEIIALLEE